MSKLTVSRTDFNNFKTDVTNTYATKSEIKAANYSTIEDLSAYQLKGDYALKSDLSGYQVKGDYALKSDLSGYQPKGEYQQKGEYQPKGDYALNSALSGYQPKGDPGLTKEDIISLIKSTMESQDDLVVKGNIRMLHPNGDEWVIGMRDQNHFAINKLDKTGKNRASGAGFLIRNDGHIWTGGGGSHQGLNNEDWYRSWQHNIHKGRR